MSHLLGESVESNDDSTAPPRKRNEQKEKSARILPGKNRSDLTYKQQSRQDAMLWAEFLYAEYKRHKTKLGEQV